MEEERHSDERVKRRDAGRMWAEVLNVFIVVIQSTGAVCCHGDHSRGLVGQSITSGVCRGVRE